MGFEQYKIVSGDFDNRDVSSLPDRPSEANIGAAALKARFDSATKNIVAPKLNALIEALSTVTDNSGGAFDVGVKPIDGLAGNNVQTVLVAIKDLLDTKETSSSHDADMATKLDVADANSMVQSIEYEESTGVFTVHTHGGTSYTIDTTIEKIPLNCYLDGQYFVLVLGDGTEQRVDLSNFLTQYEVADSDEVGMNLQNGVITAYIQDGAIQQRHLGLDIGEYIGMHAANAEASADAAAISEQNARNSELAAERYASSASNSANSANSAANYVEAQAELIAGSAEIAQNNADRVINAVSDFASDIVSTGNEQPTSDYNRLWFPGETVTVEIATAADIVEEVARQVGAGVDAYLENVDYAQKLGYKVGRDANGIYFED